MTNDCIIFAADLDRPQSKSFILFSAGYQQHEIKLEIDFLVLFAGSLILISKKISGFEIILFVIQQTERDRRTDRSVFSVRCVFGNITDQRWVRLNRFHFENRRLNTSGQHLLSETRILFVGIHQIHTGYLSKSVV